MSARECPAHDLDRKPNSRSGPIGSDGSRRASNNGAPFDNGYVDEPEHSDIDRNSYIDADTISYFHGRLRADSTASRGWMNVPEH